MQFYLFDKYGTVTSWCLLILSSDIILLVSCLVLMTYSELIHHWANSFKPTRTRFPFPPWFRLLTCTVSYRFYWELEGASSNYLWEHLIPLSHRSSWPASIHLLRMYQVYAWSCDNIRESFWIRLWIQHQANMLCFLWTWWNIQLHWFTSACVIFRLFGIREGCLIKGAMAIESFPQKKLPAIWRRLPMSFEEIARFGRL